MKCKCGEKMSCIDSFDNGLYKPQSVIYYCESCGRLAEKYGDFVDWYEHKGLERIQELESELSFVKDNNYIETSF